MSFDYLFIFSLFLATIRMSIPLVFTSLGGLFSERSGVVNIALEGFMLVGAFAGAAVGYQTHNVWLGFFSALLFGLMTGLIYAFFVIEMKADQIVTGTALNLLISGAIPLISKRLFNSTGSTPTLEIQDRFINEPLWMALLLVALITYWFYKTYSGLWVRFAGEHPEALQSSGINPKRVQWFSVAISGVFGAMGGASLSLYLSSSYSPMMSGGRGFMSLAAMIFGQWKPIPTVIACLFFGFADALQIRLQGVHISGQQIPVQFIQILPYLLTILALTGFVGKSKSPAALGKTL